MFVFLPKVTGSCPARRFEAKMTKMLTKMLTYEGVFGEKGFEECCEIEWERKTIEGNMCIRLRRL